MSNKNLPPLTSVIAKGPEAGFEFERLMKKWIDFLSKDVVNI